MEQDVRNEFNRLEGKIDNLLNITNNLALEAQEINVVKEKQRNSEGIMQDLAIESKQLRIAISDFSKEIAKMNGEASGANRVKKLVWLLFGGLIIAAIIGATTTLVMLREKVVKLETTIAQSEKPI